MTLQAAVQQNTDQHTPVMRPLFLMFDNDTESFTQVENSHADDDDADDNLGCDAGGNVDYGINKNDIY